MSVIIGMEYKKSQKRAKELKTFLLELDSICDTLYNRLEFSGVWDSLMLLEDIRVKYYTEYYEHDKILSIRKRLNEKKS